MRLEIKQIGPGTILFECWCEDNSIPGSKDLIFIDGERYLCRFRDWQFKTKDVNTCIVWVIPT